MMKRQQHQFPLVGNVLHAGFGNIISPHRMKSVRNPSITCQIVMPSCYCITPPGRCKESLKTWSYPNIKRLGSGMFFTVCMTSSQKGRLSLVNLRRWKVGRSCYKFHFSNNMIQIRKNTLFS